jgi:hypothetical protein
MNDAALSRLVTALDTAVESTSRMDGGPESLHADLELAALRLRCLSRRLGAVADESPYLAFLRRTARQAPAQANLRMAASA